MRLRLGGVLVLVALAAFMLAGCGKNPAAPSNSQSAEQMLVTSSLDSVATYTDDGVYNNSGVVTLARAHGVAGTASVMAAISPIHFWRTFTSVASAYNFTFADLDSTGRPLLAVVGIGRAIRGDFHIVPGVPGDTTQPDTTHLIDKPITEGWTRKLLFHRVKADTLGLTWRLVATSGVRVARPGITVHIVSVELHGLNSGKDTTYTDPSLLMPLREIPRFTPSDSVVVTVTSMRNDDVAVLYCVDRRIIMHNNGDNTYTAGFGVGSFPAWRHVGINVMTHGTLYDDTLPYDSETWIFPYMVTSTPVVDYLP